MIVDQQNSDSTTWIYHSSTLSIVKTAISTLPLLLLIVVLTLRRQILHSRWIQTALARWPTFFNHLSRLARPFRPFLTIREAELRLFQATHQSQRQFRSTSHYDNNTVTPPTNHTTEASEGEGHERDESSSGERQWRTISLGLLAICEVLGWCSVLSYTLYTRDNLGYINTQSRGGSNAFIDSNINSYPLDFTHHDAILNRSLDHYDIPDRTLWLGNSLVILWAWSYCAYEPLKRPRLTPLYDCFALYILLGAKAMLDLGRHIYDTYVYEIEIETSIDGSTGGLRTLLLHLLRDPLVVITTLLNLTIIGISLAITLTTSVSNPGSRSGLIREKGEGLSQSDDIRTSDGKPVSPEDYTTLWRWITFSWLTPIMKLASGNGRGPGESSLLNKEEDVWSLCPTMSTRPVYSKFVESWEPPSTHQSVRGSLDDDGGTRAATAAVANTVTPTQFFWNWWRCNSLDMILHFVLSSTTATLEFAGPLFLKLILDSVSTLTTLRSGLPSSPSPNSTLAPSLCASGPLPINFSSNPTAQGPPTHRIQIRQITAQIVVYALLYLFIMVFKAELEVNQLWCGRRAAVRTRNQIMMAIYEKALKRRDVVAPSSAAPIFKSSTETSTSQTSVSTSISSSASATTATATTNGSADIGKVVNLMSTDTRTIESTIHNAYFFITPSIRIIIAVIFLYNLMGLSAFVGVVVFIIIAPINHVLSGKSVKIYEELQSARDAKMSVLNEMISEIKFIKYLAYEDLWIKKALDARVNELRVILQSSYLDIALLFIWNLSPVGVSVLSFWAYIWSGHQLTVSTAFTVIQVFSMVKLPLGTLPTTFVLYFKVKISIERIVTFLGEPQVESQTDEASGNDNSHSIHLGSERLSMQEQTGPEEMVGIKNGNFLWMEPMVLPSDQIADAGSTNARRNRYQEPLRGQFQLRNINVQFPPGKLSVITGPTASGKTALLRALLGEMYTIPSSTTPLSTLEPELHTRVYLPRRPRKSSAARLRDDLSFVSYAAQTPWLEHLSIKENIIFGNPYNEARYKSVLESCALGPDLAMFEYQDETEIGERGVTLSGGQKARVALARAVYAPTKYVLLDDPLSAVDSHTARCLVDHLLAGSLLANRTVILVTHHLDLVLPVVRYVVYMQEGRIQLQGDISDLRQQGLLKRSMTASTSIEGSSNDSCDLTKPVGSSVTGVHRDEDDQDERNLKGAQGKATGASKTNKGTNDTKRLVENEKIAEGRVNLSVYHSYLKASACVTWVAVILFTFLGSGMQIGEKFWMQLWGNAYKCNASLEDAAQARDSFPSLPSANDRPMFYVAVYSLIGLVAVIGKMLASAILVLGAYRASRILFRRLLNSVTHATMRWHDTTPTGRILNRFSKDFETIDTAIATSFSNTLNVIASMIISFITIVAVAPAFMIPGVFIAYIYVSLCRAYLSTTRPLKRLDSITLSPIYAFFRVSLEGLSTIRAFSAERRFLDRMIEKLDDNSKCYWAYWMVNRWVLIRFDWLGSLTVATVMILVVAFGEYSSVHLQYHSNATNPILDQVLLSNLNSKNASRSASSGFEGLAIVTAMGFTVAMYWTCRNIAQLELDLNSVERIDQYLELPQEPAPIIVSHRPPAYWPSTSTSVLISSAYSPTSPVKPFISIENLVVKYASNLPPVLHGVSFSIKAGEHVALVGRTGSGKSTLATSFLRFVDPTEGCIIIDGVDVTTIGLEDLRSRITFIPQDSVLFSGTIRQNLDPFDEHTDEACLDVLRRVHLVEQSHTALSHTVVSPSIEAGPVSERIAPKMAPGLDSKRGIEPFSEAVKPITLSSLVTSGGFNFSHGQRQLIALARALLRRTSIIIMDEATSSIDFETDNKIQETLKEEFRGSCVITIAHRLQTIIDYDRVIVLDSGKVVQSGSPNDLINEKNGVFYSMWVDAKVVH